MTNVGNWDGLTAVFCESHMDIYNIYTQSHISRTDGFLSSAIQLQDGRIVAVEEDTQVVIIDKQGNIDFRFEQLHTQQILALTQLRDGRLVSGGEELSLRFCDIDRNECILVRKNVSPTMIWSLRELASGELAIGSEGAFLIIELKEFTKVKKIPMQTDWSSVDNIIELQPGVIGFRTLGGEVQIWDRNTDKTILFSFDDHFIESFSFPDQNRIITNNREEIKIWNLEGTCLMTIHMQDEISTTKLVTPKLLLCAGKDGVILVDIEKGEYVTKLETNYPVQSVLAIT
jgi:WD40 repeat protein